ncbi:cobalamin-independent synthase [Thamnocephalis sphaerospora]|uniref:5-methyltetrahydropteroyltriglutamate--homocysteine S-methyltransferase n=1 Tax=Thamnocephalis sphaerospora TaxID=78915 RepID=A0A4P9XM21_9FUNG|nr:cobalamin-independent synthase [Thamnocephalis sphaerospora]|eukprot:RKP06943.1 cobalamin-independent synthase [Thamnocephalis sphaerospora]
MVTASALGFPRIGAKRELKRLVEGYWSGKTDTAELLDGVHQLRIRHWRLQADKGLDTVPVGDASLYDHVLDTSVLFGVVPVRYQSLQPGLEAYFAMARGLQRPATESAPAIDVPAMEMKKWFDTNYHYIVPEFEQNQAFQLADEPKILAELAEARALGLQARPVLLGPVSYLLLGKPARGVSAASFDRFALLPALLVAYVELLDRLTAAGATWVQIDEPALVLDLSDAARAAYPIAYRQLAAAGQSKLRLLLTTYFGSVGNNLDLLTQLPIHGVHVDLARAPEQLDAVLNALGADQHLSLGLINGRNIWKANLAHALTLARKAVAKLGTDRVIVSSSSSLLHVPHSTAGETAMDAEIRDWLAFATEKLDELAVLAKALNNGEDAVRDALDDNARVAQARAASSRTHNPETQRRLQTVQPSMFKRQTAFESRRAQQQARLKLPRFATTTVGSFPQTREVRQARAKLRKGEWTQDEYAVFIRAEIERTVRFQERIGLDVLVHGESERNDMVEFFGESLQGYVFSQGGWVSSYGTRCVKPPIIYGDIVRPKPMTLDETVYAQSLTSLPMKGMLTGPITCLQWSFVRDDQPRRDTAFQLALAIRDEVSDLEAAGIPVIQIDEPAIREGLPLRRADWDAYLAWAVDAFLLSSTGVSDATQIHTHMCYSDFNDIFSAIKRMDADVITIENSRSDLKLLSAFEQHSYTNWIGPGIYDIHSPRVPSVEEMKERLSAILQFLPNDLVWVNPDCGLKTRGWPEVEAALTNLVAVARALREKA